mgnify:CR=1 FL=1
MSTLTEQLRAAMHRRGVTINDASIILEDCREALESVEDLKAEIEKLTASYATHARQEDTNEN